MGPLLAHLNTEDPYINTGLQVHLKYSMHNIHSHNLPEALVQKNKHKHVRKLVA